MTERDSGNELSIRPSGRTVHEPDRTTSDGRSIDIQGRDRLDRAWERVAEALRGTLGVDRFDRWFSAIRLLDDSDGRVTFGVPNLFIEGWIRRRYRSELEAAVIRALGKRQLAFKVDGQLFQQFRRDEAQFLEAQRDVPDPLSRRDSNDRDSSGCDSSDCDLKDDVPGPAAVCEPARDPVESRRPKAPPPRAENTAEGTVTESRPNLPSPASGLVGPPHGTSGGDRVLSPTSRLNEGVLRRDGGRPAPERVELPSRKRTVKPAGDSGGAGSQLNDVLTLDSYVVGSCNHVAFNAGMEVLRQPGRSYNPLFVYGDSGLGKTHLLQGLTREYFRQGVRQIRYLPCEEFVNRFVRSVQARDIDKFRRLFHRLKVLVLDDVHVLQNKPQSQVELLHAIDAIASAGGQVVLASDSRPNAIQKLQKQLLGRFVSGLVCRIQPPDYPTRLAILRRESMARGVDVPEDVRHAIARQQHKNVRELIGALVRVVASASLLGAPLTEASALEALEDTTWSGHRPVNLERILELQASRHGLPEAEFKARSRARSISLARQEAMYLARVLTDHSLAEIGRFFGGRNHATVNFAFQKVRTRMNEEASYQQAIEGAIRRLRG